MKRGLCSSTLCTSSLGSKVRISTYRGRTAMMYGGWCSENIKKAKRQWCQFVMHVNWSMVCVKNNTRHLLQVIEITDIEKDKGTCAIIDLKLINMTLWSFDVPIRATTDNNIHYRLMYLLFCVLWNVSKSWKCQWQPLFSKCFVFADNRSKKCFVAALLQTYTFCLSEDQVPLLWSGALEANEAGNLAWDSYLDRTDAGLWI